MTSRKTLMVAIMDIPYESADSTTALHIIHAALKDGHNVRVFAMEGTANLTAKARQSHANSVRERSVEEERQTATEDGRPLYSSSQNSKVWSSIGWTVGYASMTERREIGQTGCEVLDQRILWMPR